MSTAVAFNNDNHPCSPLLLTAGAALAHAAGAAHAPTCEHEDDENQDQEPKGKCALTRGTDDDLYPGV